MQMLTTTYLTTYYSICNIDNTKKHVESQQAECYCNTPGRIFGCQHYKLYKYYKRYKRYKYWDNVGIQTSKLYNLLNSAKTFPNIPKYEFMS